MASAARTYLGLGALLIAVHLAVGGSSGIYEGIGLASAGAIAIAVGVHRPENWLGWSGIAVATGLFAAGDLVYQHSSASFPGVPDVLYLLSYAVLLPSLVLLAGKDFPRRDWGGHIDAVLITTALAVAAWMVFLDDKMQLTFSAASFVSAAYPIADVLAIGVMIRFALVPGRRNASYWLLLLALLPLLVSDGSYVLPALGTDYHLGSWLDVGWLGSYVLIAAAALHPTMARFASADGRPERLSLPVRRVIVGGLAIACLPIAVAYESAMHRRLDIGVLLIAGVVVIVGMVARGVMLVHELDRERRRAEASERRLRMIFDGAPIGISVGRDGIMSETNPALQKMLGYTGEEFAQMHYLDVTDLDDRALAVQLDLNVGKRDSFSIDKRYVAKDGRVLDTHVHVALDLEDGLGVSIIEDISERKELEEQLLQAQKMDAIGKLAGGVAHDFNNLMTAVLGYSDLMLAKLPPGDVNREKVEAIRESAVRASDLTRQLLAFGRRQMLRAADVDLRDAVRGMDSLLRSMIGEDVRLETAFDPQPVIVRADPTQLEQVVMNLAVNARDAMLSGGTLSIGVAREGDDAVLYVADTGVGMDEATRERIFEPFFTTKPAGAGSGLGLSTVYGIVGQTGGSLEVESEPGHGTRFVIRLPLVGAERELPFSARDTKVLTD
jgi:PAS domain S-box-containing protein